MFLILFTVVLALALLFVVQRRLIYQPYEISQSELWSRAVNEFGGSVQLLAGFDALVIEPFPNQPARRTAILFHGNGGLNIDRAVYAGEFQRRGIRLVLAEYPGYGARVGKPSQEAIVSDAEQLYGLISARYPTDELLLVGESLGSGVAIQLATRADLSRRPQALVLITPFMSLARTASLAFFRLPVGWLVRDRFDSASAISQFKGQCSILIAGRDEVVGALQGRELARLARARGATSVVELENMGHNTWFTAASAQVWETLLRW
jgi:alpha-beta hydrolase superfamily lysophospholipase